MNILFVNYGDFTTNSLNHIGGFANTLCARGHECVVAVPTGRRTLESVASPLFVPATFDEALARPNLFPDGRSADVIHAWTPREVVRKFVLAYQRLAPSHLIVHLEDNEEFLTASYAGRSIEELRELDDAALDELLTEALSHPRYYRNFLRLADRVTVITERLREFVPPHVGSIVLPPGVDFSLYSPQAPDPTLRHELGLRDDEKVIVFTGSNTFANEPEMRELYLAVQLLNQRGTPTRLVRTGFNSEQFKESLAFDWQKVVLDLGFVEKTKLPKLLALADVLVQPGRANTFNDYRLPSKLPEFLAMGRPVILPATNLAKEMHDGVDALFLQTGTPEEIATACQRVFAEPKLAAKLGEGGRAFAQKQFDLESTTTKLAALYSATIGVPIHPRWQKTSHGAQATHDVSLIADLIAELVPKYPAEAAAAAHDLGRITRQLEAEAAAGRAVSAQQTRSEPERGKLQRELTLTRQHAANLEESLAATRQHVRNLEQAVEKNAVLRHQADVLLSSARQQLKAFEEELMRVEQARAHLKSELTDTEQLLADARSRIGELMRLNSVADAELLRLKNTQRRELEQLALELQQEKAAREEGIRLRDDKIRRMQQSFSWQITSPLRAARRLFVDRNQPKIVIASTASVERSPTAEKTESLPPTEVVGGYLFSIDSPTVWRDLDCREIKVRGWCLRADGAPVSALRVRSGRKIFPVAHGLKRLDVHSVMPDRNEASTAGFTTTIYANGTHGEFAFEAQTSDGGWECFFNTAYFVAANASDGTLDPYQRWIAASEDLSAPALRKLADTSVAWPHRPLISVVMPTYNTPEKWLVAAIESVRAQTYSNWELCIADDASTTLHVRGVLESYARQDARIKVCFREKNGHISAASNSALALATGEFVALLDHDDELAPHALHEVVSILVASPEIDLVYSDEDKIDEEGRRFSPYFKPDFLPDLFTAQNYITHLCVYRTELLRAAGGFRINYEGSQDWDVALRCVEKTSPDRIRHVPKILYHWRAIAGSTALALSEKKYPVEAARKALREHFDRIGEKVELITVPGDHWRVKYPLPNPAPLVSLIIPTRNGLKLLRRCVDSILEKTSYPKFEIVIVDNGSDDPATLDYFRALEQREHPAIRAVPATKAVVRVLRDNAPFNYSALNNRAVAQARGELVGLLNNDLEVIHGGWLDEMASQAARPGIGCVGAMLYYPDDTIQHAGAVLGIGGHNGVGGVAGHAFKRFPRGTEGVFNRARLVQNYSAVTAACLVVRKSTYQQVGGMDEKDLTIAFNDIDFCLKVRAAGYRNLWTPFAELYHHESASRGFEDTPEKHQRFRKEIEAMHRRWGDALLTDPAYNPNLTLEHEDFAIAAKSRVV